MPGSLASAGGAKASPFLADSAPNLLELLLELFPGSLAGFELDDLLATRLAVGGDPASEGNLEDEEKQDPDSQVFPEFLTVGLA